MAASKFTQFIQQMSPALTKTVIIRAMLIMVSFAVIIAISTITIIRFKKQLEHNQLAQFQHKTIKWFYIACLAVFPITVLIVIAAAAIELNKLINSITYSTSTIMPNIATLAILTAILSIFIMAWVLPECDKLLNKFNKG